MTIFSVVAIRLIRDKCIAAIDESKAADLSMATYVGNGLTQFFGFAPVRIVPLAEQKRALLSNLIAALDKIQSNTPDTDTLDTLQKLVIDCRNGETELTRNKAFTGSDQPVKGTTEKMLGYLVDALPAMFDQFATLQLLEKKYDDRDAHSMFIYLIALYFSKRALKREESPSEILPPFVGIQESLLVDTYNNYLAQIAKIDKDAAAQDNTHAKKLYQAIKADRAALIIHKLGREHLKLVNTHGEPAPYSAMLTEGLEEIEPILEQICNTLSGVENLEYEEAVSLFRPGRGVVRAAAHPHKLQKQPSKLAAAAAAAPVATSEQGPDASLTHDETTASSGALAAQVPPRANSAPSAASLQPVPPQGAEPMGAKVRSVNASQATQSDSEELDLDEPAPRATPAKPEQKSQPEAGADGRESPSRKLGLFGVAAVEDPVQKAATPELKLTKAQRRALAIEQQQEATGQAAKRS